MSPFPEPKEFQIRQYGLTIHQRYRIVSHSSNSEDAIAKAEQISEQYACDLESFVVYVNDETGEALGEIVLGRKLFPCKQAMTAAEPENET